MDKGASENMKLIMDVMVNKIIVMLDGAMITPFENTQKSSINAFIQIKSFIKTFGKEENINTVMDFINALDLYDEEDIEIFIKRLSHELLETTLEFPDKVDDILDIFLNDTIDMFRKVLSQDLVDPHYSGIIAMRQLQQYLNATENPKNKVSFLLDKGFTKEEILELERRNKMELEVWNGEQPVDWL